ncbi:hypothetical protein D3C75_991740 [compost metagenome]
MLEVSTLHNSNLFPFQGYNQHGLFGGGNVSENGEQADLFNNVPDDPLGWNPAVRGSGQIGHRGLSE